MNKLYQSLSATAVFLVAFSADFVAASDKETVADSVISDQREALAEATAGAGFGPQSPRDIDVAEGSNRRASGLAPAHTQMNLCNIHFHEGAEHRGGEFTTYAGNGNGEGSGTGFKYNGELTEAELAPLSEKVGPGKYGDLVPGDTIEIHFVHSSAQVKPGPTLGACISEAIKNPHLRVETVVAVLVNDAAASDFTQMAALSKADGLHQAANIPTDLGTPVVYQGSTTGPSYNQKASPFHVTWSVRPKVAKLDISSVNRWFADNPFEERSAHGVRNLVLNRSLLSPISN